MFSNESSLVVFSQSENKKILKTFSRFYLIGLSKGLIDGTKIYSQHVPGDLLDYMNIHYETGQPEMDSRNIQIDYQGTNFQEPEVLPDDSMNCNGEENADDDNFAHVDYGDDTDGKQD